MDSNRGKTVLISSTKGEQFHMNAGADLYGHCCLFIIRRGRGRGGRVSYLKGAHAR